MGVSAAQGSAGLKAGVCTSTTRPSNPFEGQMIYETNTDLTYIYGGTAWQQVSGGTAVGNSGLVYISTTTFSGNATTQFTSAFSSTYTNYRAVFSYTASTGTSVYLRWLVGATVQTGNTLSQIVYSQYSLGTVLASTRGDQYGLFPSAYPTYPSTFSVEFYSPQAATYSSYAIGGATLGTSSSDSYFNSYGGRNIATTQMDGFEITTASTPTIAGTMTLYGYRNL